MKKIATKICAVLLCFVMAFMAAPISAISVYAETPAEKLERLRREQSEIEKNIAANKNNAKKQIQVKNMYAQKAEIERQKLEELASQIATQEEALAVKQQEIAAKVEELARTKELFENRLVATYKKKDRSAMSALLSVSDFGSLMRASKNLQRIAKADNELMQLLAQQQAELEALRLDIEASIVELNNLKTQTEETKAQYENSMKMAQAAADAAAAAQKANEAAYAENLPKVEQAEREYAAWVAQEIQGGDFVGGEFMWPVPGHTSVSSGFGVVRYIFGKRDVHRGIDIPAPSGTPIYAAADGTASVNGHHYTYGNCIKISHGGGVVSVYAHMLSFAPGISEGMTVVKGQLIGYVGSTGNSTGNHLHFEIDINGKPVNPYGYLGS